MRVGLKDTNAVGGATHLDQEKWYEAERLAGDPRTYEVTISRKQVQVPAEAVEVRSVPEDTWEKSRIRSAPAT